MSRFTFIQSHTNRRLSIGVVLLVACGIFVFADQAQAIHHPQNLIGQDAQQLHCLADKMRDEIKTHFRGADGYRKLLTSCTLVKTKSGAIARRVGRNCNYRGLGRDLKKLDEWTCRLLQQFNTVVRCNPESIRGSIGHVALQMNAMHELKDLIVANFEGRVINVDSTPNELSTLEDSLPWEVAPAAPETFLNDMGDFKQPGDWTGRSELSDVQLRPSYEAHTPALKAPVQDTPALVAPTPGSNQGSSQLKSVLEDN